ncbi:MAG: pantetheine-phosphate adenylyltransferase [Firmicutes bacterium]|jgi:pantetheine-phosphate adenylyltransferase|nr:pantetheine-phosphate adenylyltransferase [Bacillota bacterium]HPU02087.1 pantetheine-phosphate adenylyltransferase [Bacillota bacterium]
MEKAIYPGSFDPVTKGHLDIISRTSSIVDHLIVAVLENPRKQTMFSVEERLEMLRRSTARYSNVEIDYFGGLLVDYVKKNNIRIIIKGLRAISDFEFEFQMALVNRKLCPTVETLFMVTNSKYSYLSSSIVKEIAGFGGDIKDLVPPEAYDLIMQKFRGL